MIWRCAMTGLLCALLLIGCDRIEAPPRYQAVQYTPGILVRLDTRIGEMRAYSLKKADEPHQKASGEAWEIHELASFPLALETRKAADAERAKSDAAARIKWAEQQKLEAERQPLFDECMRRLKDAPTPPGRPSDWKGLECWAHSFNVPSTPEK